MPLPPEPRLREGGPADLAEIVRLETLAFPSPWNEAQVASQLALPSTRSWLLVAGSPPCARAGALFQVAGEEAELLRVAVEPGFRGQGLARRLLESAFAALARDGVGRIHLEVAEGNREALALYRRLGFVLQGRRAAYYASGEAALLLARDAADPGTAAERVLS